MRSFWIASLLLAGLAFAQTRPAPTGPDKKEPSTIADDDDEKTQVFPASASKVGPDAPVLTIKGFCPSQAASTTTTSIKKSASPSLLSQQRCETIVTRAEFEALANAISPAMSLQVRRQLASAYPRMLVMAHQAELRGLDKTARFAQLQRFSNLQILGQEMVREIQEESSKLPDSVIQDYYRNNPAPFEQADLERILVPNKRRTQPLPEGQANDSAVKAQQKEAEDEMAKEARTLRARAATGEDFAKLQHEAFETAGIGNAVSTIRLEKVRRTNLPSSHAVVFDLKPGEVSQVFTDASGNYIYKLAGRELKPLDEVRDEIRNTLQSQNLQEAMQKIRGSFTTDTNEDYFGPGGSAVSAPGAPANAGHSPDDHLPPKRD